MGARVLKVGLGQCFGRAEREASGLGMVGCHPPSGVSGRRDCQWREGWEVDALGEARGRAAGQGTCCDLAELVQA